MDLIQQIGRIVRSIVLSGAAYLREDYAPGLVTLALVAALLICCALFLRETRAHVAAMRRLNRAIRQFNDGEQLSARFDALQREINGFRSASGRKIAAAWNEFAETLILQDEGGRPIYHNSVRPSAFFNLEDLGFGAGFWRHMPGLFVSIGLFLTFLGLVSALDSMASGSGGTIGAEQLNVLLTVASAKFIMSLTGLACSIVFTIVLRFGIGRAEDVAHTLSAGIEERLSFLSLERLAADQLAAVRAQREFMQTLGHELVAELGRPLKEEIPRAISSSIETAMRPLIDQVGKAGADGVGAMVDSLSARFTDDVGKALNDASRHLAQAGDRIAELSARMDQSSGKVGDELNIALTRVSEAVGGIRDTLGEAARDTGGTFNAGAEKLLGVMNQTLEGIRENTSAGAAAMSAAASDLRQAGEGFRQQLEHASRTGGEVARGHIEAAGQELGRIASEASEKAAFEILGPLDEIANKMAGVVNQVAAASTDFRLLADGVRSGADASVLAATTFRAASQDLSTAADPIRSAIGGIQASVSSLAETTQSVGASITRSADSTARSAADALAAAQAVLGSEQRAIENALAGIGVALDRLREQGARIDDIDGKLGRAFEIYTQQVAGAVDGMRHHVQELQQTMQPAIDTLKSVVESAEEFIPRSRAR
ncbi:hypothetical protein C3941_02005 [Kaistia algarum]|nr:hypothetical protein C3941_02005 [Kaistia algarum]